MSTALIHMSAATSVRDAAACVKEHGYVIIDGLSSDQQMDHVSEELDPYINNTDFGKTVITGELTRRTGSLVARSRTCRDIIVNPLVLGIVGECLTSPDAFQISLTEVISLSPGAEAQFIHRDGPSDSIADNYEAQISTLWAMTDYTEDMGATRLVPGSHRLPYGMKYSAKDTVPAVMSRGSVLIYSGKLYHGGGSNNSRNIRQAININYTCGWIRQEENQYLSCPSDVAKELPPQLLKLMGYETFMSFGRVGDWGDPLMAIVGETRRLDENRIFGIASR